MGDVYLNCPLNGGLHWYDWCTHRDYVNRYGTVFDTGRFIWVSA